MQTATLFVLLCICLGAQAKFNITNPEWWPRLTTVGSWNVMLQPWFLWEENVLKNVVKLTGPDVLALEEVWTKEARDQILNVPGRRLKYPYYHYVEPRVETAGCNVANDPELLGLVQQYVGCLMVYGVDTRTLQQPLHPLPMDCLYAAVLLGIHQYNPANQLCLACLINAMENLPVDHAADSIGICATGQGPKYGHGGNNGILILSSYPITDVKEVNFDAFIVSRVNIHATINGVRFGFGHFAFNLLADIDPSLAPLMYGALQTDQAQDFIDAGVDVVVGDFNSGPNYQSAGYDRLVSAGYAQVTPAVDTWCRESHASFTPCINAGAPPAFAIDHVMVRQSSHIIGKWGRIFNEYPVDMSDHVGVSATLISFHRSAGLEAALANLSNNN